MKVIDQMPGVDLCLGDDGAYHVHYTEEAVTNYDVDDTPIRYYMLEDARQAMYQMSDNLLNTDIEVCA